MDLRAIGVSIVAIAVLVSATSSWAGDSDELALPNAMAVEDLSQATARGDEETSATVQKLSSRASANATIDNVTIVNPSSTGGVSGLNGLIGDTTAAVLQISTGSGNIQQGVQAVALSF